MRKYDFFKGQFPSQAEFDQQQENFDDGIKDFLLAHSYQGIVAGLVATASPGAPTFDLVITAGTAYDKNGEHCYVATDQTIDVSKDELGATTYTDIGVGEFRWVSIFLHFDRALSDPRIDDDKNPLHFIHAESYTIRVVNGTKGAAPVTEPALHADDILIADLYMYNGMADVLAADIHVHRREEVGYYRSSTGGIVKHKNDTMLGPDMDCIEETLDDSIAISGYRKYGNRFVEYRDRQHVRITSRLAEFNDDFYNTTLQDWWTSTPAGAPVLTPSPNGVTWGGYSIKLRNGNNDEELLQGAVLLALEDQLVLEVAMSCGTAPDAEHGMYFGIEAIGSVAHDHTEEGFGFYHAGGNWFAANVSVALAVTATDTLVAVDTTRHQRLRAHCICNSAGVPTKILFYIDEALVATHTTNLPSTVGAAFQPFSNYASIPAPAVTSDKCMIFDRFFVGGLRKYFHE